MTAGGRAGSDGTRRLGPGDVFAGIRIEELCGTGGMGVVYRGRQLALDRTVALKLIAPELARAQGFRERFQREARIAASIEHPNVVPIYEAGEADGLLYLVMRFVAGTDLRALIAYEGRLEPASAAEIVSQVAAGLDAAHAAGLVHRDVKPANVLLEGDADAQHAYLTDFGVAAVLGAASSLTATGQQVGTLDYAAPELLEQGTVDGRADVYSLGALLFAALTGGPPFRRETATATMLAHLREPIPRASDTEGVAPAFDAVIGRALAKWPEERFGSAGELARAAQAAARGAPVALDDEATVADQYVAPAPPRKRRRLRAKVALIAAPVVAGAIAAGILVATAGDDGTAGGATTASPGLQHPIVKPDDDPLRDRFPANEKPTPAQMRSAVAGFQRAYEGQDLVALRSLLLKNIHIDDWRANLSPVKGVEAALDYWKREFALLDSPSYRITRLELQTGFPSGRAVWRYELTRDDGRVDRGRVDALLERRGDAALFSAVSIYGTP